MIPVIIPFYKKQEQLDRCLDHLKCQTLPVEVFIHDNTHDNIYFTKAVNKGLRHFLSADCDYMIVLNQDMYLEPNAVEEMVTFMDNHPHCGIGGPLEHIMSDPQNRVLAGGLVCFPDGSHVLAQPDHVRHCKQIYWANGSCMILRKTMMQEIGLLDENLEFICSDSDYCFTARTRGWEVWRIGTALGHHEHGASGKCSDPTIQLLKIQDSLHFAKKWINGGLYRQIAHIPADHTEAYLTEVIEILEQNRDRLATQIQQQPPVTEAPTTPLVQTLLHEAIRCHRLGEIDQAERLYSRVLEHEPHQSQALHSLGILAYSRGDYDDAQEFVSQAIQEDPKSALQYNSMGVIYEALHQDTKAQNAFTEAIRRQHDYIEAHCNLGQNLMRQGQLDKAEAHLQQTLTLAPQEAMGHLHLGQLYQQQHRWTEAETALNQALNLQPTFAEACHRLANNYQAQHQLDRALVMQKRALELAPEHPPYLSHYAGLLQEAGQLDEALKICQKVIHLLPKRAEGYYNLGCVLRDQCHLTEAIEANRTALEKHPTFAEAHWNQAVCLLTAGQTERAWDHYPWRHRVNNHQLYPHQHYLPRWDGSPLNGLRLFVHCEQGLGDAIQMARFLPALQERGAKVVFGVWRPLVSLMEYVPGADEIIALDWHTSPQVQADVMISLMDVPQILRWSPEHTPTPTQGLTFDPMQQIHWQRHWGQSPHKVGLVWAGSAQHTNDRRRSCDWETLSTLTQVPGIHWVSLQRDGVDLKTRQQLERAGVEDISDSLKDFTDTAAAISNLDLVISVDTAVLHLAATLGKPTWGLLAFSPDWRWMLDRQDTPWYASMRLFRQDRPGDWHGLLNQVTTALQKEWPC